MTQHQDSSSRREIQISMKLKDPTISGMRLADKVESLTGAWINSHEKAGDTAILGGLTTRTDDELIRKLKRSFYSIKIT